MGANLPMNNVTKFRIEKPVHEVFEAFVDPEKIGNFWFSASSERWEAGKTITLEYDLYNAKIQIYVAEVEENKKIMFKGGSNHTVTITLNELDHSSTSIEVVEEGFNENDANFIHQILDNKAGWVFVLTCLKAYLEFGVNGLRGGLLKG